MCLQYVLYCRAPFLKTKMSFREFKFSPGCHRSSHCAEGKLQNVQREEKREAVNYIAGRALGRKVQWQVSSVSSSSHWVITRSMKVAHSPRLRPNKIEGTREQGRKGSFILGTWSYTGSSSFFVYYVYNESMLDYIFYILILIIKQNWTLSPFY